MILERKKQATEAARILGVQKIFFGNFPDNSMDSVPLLKIIQFIEKHIKKIKPDTIFTHFESDLNVDHQITSKAVITACRPIKNQTVKSILFFDFFNTSPSISLVNEKFEEIFNNEVSLRLPKDVSFNTPLSGGIDSAVLTKFISKFVKNYYKTTKFKKKQRI